MEICLKWHLLFPPDARVAMGTTSTYNTYIVHTSISLQTSELWVECCFNSLWPIDSRIFSCMHPASGRRHCSISHWLGTYTKRFLVMPHGDSEWTNKPIPMSPSKWSKLNFSNTRPENFPPLFHHYFICPCPIFSWDGWHSVILLHLPGINELTSAYLDEMWARASAAVGSQREISATGENVVGWEACPCGGHDAGSRPGRGSENAAPHWGPYRPGSAVGCWGAAWPWGIPGPGSGWPGWTAWRHWDSSHGGTRPSPCTQFWGHFPTAEGRGRPRRGWTGRRIHLSSSYHHLKERQREKVQMWTKWLTI